MNTYKARRKKKEHVRALYTAANKNLSENDETVGDAAFETRDRICNLYRCFIARTPGVGIFLHAFFACKYARFRRELRQRTVFVTLLHILKHIYPHVYKM